MSNRQKTPLVAFAKKFYNGRIVDEASSPTPPKPPNAIDISGDSVHVDGDIIGGDVHIAGDSIRGQTVTVQRGFSAAEVQRLALAVGGLVFLTAACFFIFGAVSVAAFVSVLNRPVQSSTEAALTMRNKLNQLETLAPGDNFRVVFTEDEISSYFRFIAGPNLGISNGKARLMDTPGQIALGGNLDSAGGLPIAAEMAVTTDTMPLELKAVWIKIIPTPEGVNFGWIPVTALAQGLQRQINAALFGAVQFTHIAQTGGGSGAQPAIGINLILQGVAK